MLLSHDSTVVINMFLSCGVEVARSTAIIWQVLFSLCLVCDSPTTILKDRSCGTAQIINQFYVVVLSWRSTSV